jgi:hypothetical protein
MLDVDRLMCACVMLGFSRDGRFLSSYQMSSSHGYFDILWWELPNPTGASRFTLYETVRIILDRSTATRNPSSSLLANSNMSAFQLAVHETMPSGVSQTASLALVLNVRHCDVGMTSSHECTVVFIPNPVLPNGGRVKFANTPSMRISFTASHSSASLLERECVLASMPPSKHSPHISMIVSGINAGCAAHVLLYQMKTEDSDATSDLPPCINSTIRNHLILDYDHIVRRVLQVQRHVIPSCECHDYDARLLRMEVHDDHSIDMFISIALHLVMNSWEVPQPQRKASTEATATCADSDEPDPESTSASSSASVSASQVHRTVARIVVCCIHIHVPRSVLYRRRDSTKAQVDIPLDHVKMFKFPVRDAAMIQQHLKLSEVSLGYASRLLPSTLPKAFDLHSYTDRCALVLKRLFPRLGPVAAPRALSNQAVLQNQSKQVLTNPVLPLAIVS